MEWPPVGSPRSGEDTIVYTYTDSINSTQSVTKKIKINNMKLGGVLEGDEEVGKRRGGFG